MGSHELIDPHIHVKSLYWFKNFFLLCRTQFVDPNIAAAENTEKTDENSNDDEYDGMSSFVIDPDHRLLLKSMKPLLQSRNSAVNMRIRRFSSTNAFLNRL